jgi:hypothetical protein
MTSRAPWQGQFHDGRHSGTSCGELRAPRWFRSSGPEPPGPQQSRVRRASLCAAQRVARRAGPAAIAPQVSAAVPARPATARRSRTVYRHPSSRAPAYKGPRGDPIAGCGPGPCGRHPKLCSRSAPNRKSVPARTKGSPVDHRVAWIPGLRADKWRGESEPGGSKPARPGGTGLRRKNPGAGSRLAALARVAVIRRPAVARWTGRRRLGHREANDPHESSHDQHRSTCRDR